MLQKQIKEELKDAMRAKEAVRLGVIKGLMSAFTNELVAKRRGPDEQRLSYFKGKAEARLF